jgi:hypothetical protein
MQKCKEFVDKMQELLCSQNEGIFMPNCRYLDTEIKAFKNIRFDKCKNADTWTSNSR